jgi:hypothetical protein
MIMSAQDTRNLKAALRRAFSGTKFSVRTRYSDAHVEWPDDSGPEVDQVIDALVQAGCGEAQVRWDDGRDLYIDGSRVSLWRYNAAERVKWQQDCERHARERQERQERTQLALKAAYAAKEAAMPKAAPNQASNYETNQRLHDAFEALRERAEAESSTTIDRQRRPTWAPPLVIEGELFETCVALGYLTADGKPIARLWAQFADPKKSGGVLRDRVSAHGLSGLAVRGFELHLGSTRVEILFEAQRRADGTWRLGPQVHSWWLRPSTSKWNQLVRQRSDLEEQLKTAAEHGSNYVYQTEKSLQLIIAEIESINAAERAAVISGQNRDALRAQALVLAKARVLDFAGAPDVQMRLAARLSGSCCICGKTLTDPVSLERGIGPDCWGQRIDFIQRETRAARTEGREIPVAWISYLSGMPTDFVVAVINEMPIAQFV